MRAAPFIKNVSWERRKKLLGFLLLVVCVISFGAQRLRREERGLSAVGGASEERRSIASVLTGTHLRVTGHGEGFFLEGAPEGVPLVGRGGAGGMAGRAVPFRAKGRVVTLRSDALRGWAKLKQGETVELPWFEDAPLLGVVHLRLEDFGWLRFGGELEGGKGAFTLSMRDGEVNGAVLFTGIGIALEIRTEPKGAVVLVERSLDSKLCWPAMAAATGADGAPSAIAAGEGGVPQVNTRPGARGLIYINFEGGVATDPVWNFGKPISFAPAGLSASGVLEVVERVAEDYAPFDMAVSTILADYEAAPVGRRTRVIVTPTSTALPGSGGVAMINAWSAAGRSMSSTVPAWVFASLPKHVAEGVSHEVGHTLGLNHDGTEAGGGRQTSAYYTGHGGDVENPLSWAPIMGQAYGRALTHWSRGEYAWANNKEDDIETIKRKTNGVGYRAEAAVGGRVLDVAGGSFQDSGVVHASEGSVVYHFATLGGRLDASLKPKVARYGNVDLKLEVTDQQGKVWAVSDPVTTTVAQVQVVLPEGKYALVVSAGCTGPKPLGGYTAGYPAYGALGQFVLAGTLEKPASAPDLTSPLSVVAIAGGPFLYRLRLTSGAAVEQCLGGMPPGVEWNPAEQVLTGTPVAPGTYAVGFSLLEGARRNQQSVRITVSADHLPVLAAAVLPATTPEAPWRAQLEDAPFGSAPGSKAVVASSGLTVDGGASRLRYSFPAGGVIHFWWKVSSEIGCDFLECRVNGLLARDRNTGALLRLSGVLDWSRQEVQVEGPSVVEFVYRKDFALSEEQDRGWVAGLELGWRPVFTKMPQSRWLAAGVQEFVLEANVEHAGEYQWKKDGLSLVDGESGGRRISGARSSVLTVTGASAADSGTYVLEASNGIGTQSSRPAEVGVPGVPVVNQQIAAGAGVKAGDTLLLSVGVSSAKPFFVAWSKDGRLLRWTQSTILELPSADALMSGRYSAVVINAYGSESAGELNVRIP